MEPAILQDSEYIDPRINKRQTSLTGSANELIFAAMCMKNGLLCSLPLMANASKYDIITDYDGIVNRCQVKTMSKRYKEIINKTRYSLTIEATSDKKEQKKYTHKDCDFIIGVINSTNIYVVPINFAEKYAKTTIDSTKLSRYHNAFHLLKEDNKDVLSVYEPIMADLSDDYKMLRIGEAAKLINMSIGQLRILHQKGILNAYLVPSASGSGASHRRFRKKDLIEFIERPNIPKVIFEETTNNAS